MAWVCMYVRRIKRERESEPLATPCDNLIIIPPPQTTPHHKQHDQSVSSVGFKLEGEMNLGKLQRWLSVLLKEKGTQLFRYKVRHTPPSAASCFHPRTPCHTFHVYTHKYYKGVLAVKGYDTKWIFQV